MKIDLNFTMEYCRRWRLAQAVREVVVNARDVELQGGSFTVEHDSGKCVLRVTSEGQHLTSRALVFGDSDKSGDDRTIGQFGDGLKVALGVFLRHSCPVKINTGREIWTPCVVERDGARVVGVNTRSLPVRHHRERVTFEIGGVSDFDWRECRKGFLFLQPPVAAQVTPAGTLLRDEQHRGAVFCKGVLVERRHDLTHGYDLPSLELNRDRCVADSWQVQTAVRAVWSAVAASGDVRNLYAVLADHGQRDLVVNGPMSAASFSDSVRASVLSAFRAVHGADAVAVASAEESERAAHHGIRGVFTPPALLNVLASAGMKNVAELCAALREDVTARYTESDLTAREVDVLQSALDVIGCAVTERGDAALSVEVVDFVDASLRGLYVPGSDRILLARAVLSLRHVAYHVLAHEAAHRHGGDGDDSHRRAIEDIMGRALANLVA